MKKMIIAAKCWPKEEIFKNIKKAGISAVELYLCAEIMSDLEEVIKLCNEFPFRYALHASSDDYNFRGLAKLAKGVKAEVIVFHNIYWESEWARIAGFLKNIKAKPCVENTYSVHEPLKFIRRYGFGRCLDLEHLQMECCGVYEEEFIRVLKQATHIHLTGYIYGSKLWHTHIHHSPEHCSYLLNLIKKSGFSGYIVSEAKISLQTYEEFKRLFDFFKTWESETKLLS